MLAMMAVASAVALVVVGGATAVVRPAKVRKWTARRGGAYNCCEHCGAALRLDPDHRWRYEGVCSNCGKAQSWAPTATNGTPPD